MRNRFLALVLTTVSNSTPFSRRGLAEMGGRGQAWLIPLGIAGLGVLVFSFVAMLVRLYMGVLELGVITGTPEIVFFVATIITWTVLVFLGIAVVMSVFYFSSDIPALIPLPIPPREVIVAKFVVLLLYSYAFCALGFLPAFFVYSSRMGFSAYVTVSALFNFVLLPVIPAAVAVVFVFVLNRLISFSRYRTLLEVVGNMLFLVALVGIQLIVPRLTVGSDPPKVAQLLMEKGSLFALMGKLMPPAKLIASSIGGSENAALHLLGIFALAGALCVGMVVVGELIFYKGYIIQSQVADVARRIAGTTDVHALLERSGLLRIRPRVLAMMSREWAILRSNSTFVFSSFSEVVVFPMLLVIFRLSAENPLAELPPALSRSEAWSLACGGAAVILCGISSIYPSSVSREGSLFALSLALPVRGSVQAFSKLLFGLQFTFSAFFLDLVLLMVIFEMSPASLLYVVPMGVAALVFFGTAGVILDVHRPVLAWTHPQQAMKSNMNVLIAIGIDGLTIALVGLAVVMVLRAGLRPWEAGFFAAGIFAILDFLALRFLARASDKRYSYGFEM